MNSMAFSNPASERMDELRFRSQQSPRNGNGTGNDASLLGLVSPQRNSNRLPQSLTAQDNRGGLTRRFTTDSGKIPTIASAGTQRSAQEPQEYGPSTYHKVQLLEKKKIEYEKLRQQKRRFEAEMQLLDLQQRREEQELAQMQEDLGRNNNADAGHQSEPTTPPEFRETAAGFPSAFSRPNRYSTSSLTSPPGLYNRSGPSGSQITSPQAGVLTSHLVMADKLPSKSTPGSRRNSDEDEKEEAVRQDPTSHRSTNALNRYSMPVTRSRNGMHEMLSLDQTNTARFLFGEEEGSSSSDAKGYHLAMDATDDKFPILVRREEYPDILSASSAALDLASSQSPGPQSNANGWSAFARHRPTHSQQSLPTITNQNHTPGNIVSTTAETPISVRPSYRHSLDLKYFDGIQDSSNQMNSASTHAQATPPKLQSSYSANDVPTMRSGPNGVTNSSVNTTPNSHAQQHLHNHNASLGRIPPNAMNNRLSRDLASSDGSGIRESQNGSFHSLQSALQASAPPFGPSMTAGLPTIPMSPSMTSPSSQSQYSAQGYYNGGFNNMQMMNIGMQNMQMGPPTIYSQHSPYANYPAVYAQNNGRDSQSRVIQQRRQTDGEAMNRFANASLEQLGGEIYALCKDQHGCRFLQKKLEERVPEQVHMIWLETSQHVIELMTDPFGNYLCQKLLEFCNDDERTALIENASHDLVRIALNQHGTRALQKMIEFISTPGQVQIIIHALRFRVVELIQDLNGNHVIQKCLNKLSPAEAQFIFDAVGHHCVDVGTHRHGCCVLQRCIDHASGNQKSWLIRQISDNAYHLVQDPFGNYVVQYILDLNEPIYTEPLVAMFAGRVGHLSKQKFSSNVMEKCLRCAQDASKDMLIEEMLQPSELDRLLRDSFANYVIQTALDYASPATKARLVDAIRPHLPAIRTTPYGRRIQAKIQGGDGRSGPSSGQITPNENETSQLPLRHNRGSSNISTSIGTFTSTANAFNTSNGFASTNVLPTALPTPANSATGFSGTDRITSPQGSNNYLYQYNRARGQSGASNWL